MADQPEKPGAPVYATNEYSEDPPDVGEYLATVYAVDPSKAERLATAAFDGLTRDLLLREGSAAAGVELVMNDDDEVRDSVCEVWVPADGEPHGKWARTTDRAVTHRTATQACEEEQLAGNVARVLIIGPDR